MATGFMAVNKPGKRSAYSTLLLVFALCSPCAQAQEVGLAGLLGSKALLIVNGGEPQALAIGQTVGGVRLISIQGDQAIIDIAGKKRSLRVGQHAVGAVSSEGGGKVILTADSRGHFFTTGTINGASVRFVVDTGASSIAFGAGEARRLGLDSSRGQKGMTETANGLAEVSRIQLDTVRIGDITLHNVEAAILPTELSAALLGMSFLNRMEMQRDGSTMTLKKRF